MGLPMGAFPLSRTLSGLAFGLGASLLLTACTPEEEAKAPAPGRPVLVQSVTYEPRIATRTFVASIQPRIETDLGFRVAGKVARRLVNVGDSVKAGQPLAVLDDTDLKLQQEQADAEFRAATAALDQAQAELTRVDTLRKQGWSAAAVLDRQTAATEEARSRLDRAIRAREISGNASSYAVLQADTDGVVSATRVEPGQVVSAGQPAIRVARLDEKEAVIAVPETMVALAREGRASATLWSDASRAYDAVLREIAPSADPATRTYQARFTLKDAGPQVQLGMTATIALTAGEGDKVARLPLSALYSQGDGASVWVVDRASGTLSLKPVTVIAYESRDVLIGAGLTPGDAVVTVGVQKLDAAQKVRIVQALNF